MDDSRGSTHPILVPIVIGTGLQLLMVTSGHYSPGVKEQYVAGGLAISGLVGLLASLRVGEQRRPAAAGRGALVGGLCAFIGILISSLLGDLPESVPVLDTVSSAVTGAIGGLLGKVLVTRSGKRP